MNYFGEGQLEVYPFKKIKTRGGIKNISVGRVQPFPAPLFRFLLTESRKKPMKFDATRSFTITYNPQV
jgi:hypothetical protein